MAFAGNTAAGVPGSATLLNAGQDSSNWILPAKTYSGNRYTALTQIDKSNVATLRMAWRTDIADDGQQETSPIIWNGTMYVSTPHDGVLALDAANGKLRWQTPYNPAYVILYPVNRGVGLADGKIFIATQDCRLIALDAATGGAYDLKSNSFLVPSTDECAVWKITSDDPQYIPGQLYTGGPLPKRQNGTGVLTSIDVSTGKVRWRNALPYPSVGGGVLITASGLAFTSDVGGNLYAFDAASGHQYWTNSTGSSVVAPISAYSLDGTEYLAVVVGEAGAQQTPNLPKSAGSRVIAYRVGNAPTVFNDGTGQVALASARNDGSESPGPGAKSIGSAPYTRQQVILGRQVYAAQCAICHGANLQGTSAPALTGPGFAHSHLNASQLRTVVTQSMPLSWPICSVTTACRPPGVESSHSRPPTRRP